MESRQFDQLAVSLASGSTRRRTLTGLGAIALGMLLGRDSEAKSSANKGNSGANGNANCTAACAHTAKDERKVCQDKKNKATKKDCLKRVKQAQATCREGCVPTDTTGTVPVGGPTNETGTDPGGTDTGSQLGILAKDLCTIGGTSCQDDLGPDTCLIGTCVKQNNRARCEYTRNPDACTDPTKPVCCNYRLDSSSSGQCVQAGPEGDRNYFCAA